MTIEMISTNVPFTEMFGEAKDGGYAGRSPYQKFIESKIELVQNGGFTITADEMRPLSAAYPHQFAVAKWALQKGQALLALSFGLHKTSIQLQMLKCAQERTGGKVLIVCPLGAKHQFTEKDGPRLGMEVCYVRNDYEAMTAPSPFIITNYERFVNGDISAEFVKQYVRGVSLDEGDVLRSLGSKTYDVFVDIFKPVQYKFVATATPDPNRYIELINYAVFLGVGERSALLNEYFGRNTQKAGDLQLYPHNEEKFWLWVSTWALFITKPSDLGFSDEGFDLPPLQVHYHRIATDHSRAWDRPDRNGQASLYVDSAQGVGPAMREKRDSLDIRIAEAKRIKATYPEGTHAIFWHHLEDERKTLEDEIPGILTVWGAQTPEEKEERILRFAHGEVQDFGTKPDIAGAGCNLQHYCSTAIFIGLDYKFKDIIQAIHRIYRFQQKERVNIHFIHTDAEDSVVAAFKRKWVNHDKQVKKMVDIIKKYGLGNVEAMKIDVSRKLGVKRQERRGNWFHLVNNDCVLEIANLATNSVHMINTSIPFADHYGYVNQHEDFGHNHGAEGFFKQMDYLTPHLLRVLKPGRIAMIHVKDLIAYASQTGKGRAEIIPFSDMTVAHFRKHGFLYMGRRTIVTDVVRENNSTYRLSYSQQLKDGSKMGSGLPEYYLQFCKLPTYLSDGYADDMVTKIMEEYRLGQWQLDAHNHWNSSGNRLLTPEELANMREGNAYRWWKEHSLNCVYDYDQHRRICEALEDKGALPKTFMLLPPHSKSSWVWSDVDFLHSLNAEQVREGGQKHVCPFAFDVVKRANSLYSNPGETILDPFSGLGTTAYCAIEQGRNAIGFELNPLYWAASVKYCQEMELKRSAPTLFDMLEMEAAT